MGSSLGTTLVGSSLIAVKMPARKPFAVALPLMLVVTLAGLVLAVFMPRQSHGTAAPSGRSPADP